MVPIIAWSLGWFALSLLIVPALVLVHELAHAAVAVFLTGEQTSVTVGHGERRVALQIGRIRVSLHANPEGGSCELPSGLTPREDFAVSLAGPLASLLAGVALAAWYLAVVMPLSLDALGVPQLFIGASAVLALGQGGTSLVPRVGEEGASDGWHAREMWRDWHGTADWRSPVAELRERQFHASLLHKLVSGALAEASTLRAPHVGTEHFLITLAGWDGDVGDVLRDAGLDPAKLRGTVGRQGDACPASGLGFSPAAKRVLERSAEQADLQEDTDAARRQVLLCTLQERGGSARELVERLGSSAAGLHSALLAAPASTPAVLNAA